MKDVLARGLMKYFQVFRSGKTVSLIESLFKYKAIHYFLLVILGYYLGKQVIASPFIPMVLILLIFSILLFFRIPRWIPYISFLLIPFHWLMIYQGHLTVLKLFILAGSLFALSLVFLKKRRIIWDPYIPSFGDTFLSFFYRH